MNDVIQVVTTTASREQADELARQLVERRLAACVQILGPIASTYRWQGAIEQSQEWLCVAKTLLHRYAALEAAIRELHDYDVPEILAFPAVAASSDYADWLQTSVREPPAP